MLTFYHDLGKIVFFGKLHDANNTLNDLVILDPVWLIGVFKRVVTIMRPEKMVSFFHVFNLSFENGIFPDALKIAKVIPVFKKRQ